VHIGFFISDLGGGGTQRRVLALSRELVRCGHRVDLCVSSPEGAFADRVPPEVRLIPVDGLASQLPVLKRRRGLRVAGAVAGLAEYLGSAQPNVLVSSSNPANVAALRARARSIRRGNAPVPVVISVNVDPRAALAGRNMLHGGLLRLLLRRYYPDADAVVANTSGIAASVASVARVPPGRIVTISNPVDCAAIRAQAQAPLAHPWLAHGAPPLILAVGKLKPQKDFATLLRAFARLRADRAANLVILGEGELRPQLTELVRTLGLSGAVEMPGFCGNPHAWMARAAAFVLSSRWEGCSNVLAEALAVGCPVVSTDCPSGPSELLAGGEFGRLVPPGDPESLAAAVAATLDAPPDRSRMMARADTFSVDMAAERYLAVMREAIDRHSRRLSASDRTAA